MLNAVMTLSWSCLFDNVYAVHRLLDSQEIPVVRIIDSWTSVLSSILFNVAPATNDAFPNRCHSDRVYVDLGYRIEKSFRNQDLGCRE